MTTTTFSIEEMESLDAAIALIIDIRNTHAMKRGSHAVWKILDDAATHLEVHLKAMTNELMGKGEK